VLGGAMAHTVLYAKGSGRVRLFPGWLTGWLVCRVGG